ncbi:MAG TPA: 30S ribosomal protein S20 [Candidatus Saccharimonadales bacterium]|nr:30S ribosomal protein S20 [Candidatus Saccharimonadales bacterium]
MPIIKSAIKRVRQAAKRRSRNLQIKRAIHRDVRAFTDAVAAGDAKSVNTTLSEAVSEIDRAVKKGTMHKNTAGRRKSALQKQANTVSAPKKSASKPKAAAKPAAKKTSTK